MVIEKKYTIIIKLSNNNSAQVFLQNEGYVYEAFKMFGFFSIAILITGENCDHSADCGLNLVFAINRNKKFVIVECYFFSFNHFCQSAVGVNQL